MQKQQRAGGMSMMAGGANPFGGTAGMNMKMMQFIMPVIYVIFSIIQTSMFSIYMISSSLITLGLTSIMMFIIKLLEKNKLHKEVTTITRYGRPDPSELMAKEDKKDKE